MLDQIAVIDIADKSPKLGVAANDGKPAILLTVTKQPTTGTMELTERLDQALDQLELTMPADVRMATDIFASHVLSIVPSTTCNALNRRLHLRGYRPHHLPDERPHHLYLAHHHPLSLLASIMAMRYIGITINTMSLGDWLSPSAPR